MSGVQIWEVGRVEIEARPSTCLRCGGDAWHETAQCHVCGAVVDDAVHCPRCGRGGVDMDRVQDHEFTCPARSLEKEEG